MPKVCMKAPATRHNIHIASLNRLIFTMQYGQMKKCEQPELRSWRCTLLICLSILKLILITAIQYSCIPYIEILIEVSYDLCNFLQRTFFGTDNISKTAPFLECLASARTSAATIFKTFDRMPKIDAMSDDGKILNCGIKGNIEYRNSIVFSYPSRPDVPIL